MSGWRMLGPAVAAVGLASCTLDEVSRSWSGTNNRPIQTPDVPEASVAAAARVDQVGRQLLAANPFLGLDPTFQTVGRPEVAVWHADRNGVFVTEGLVMKCPTDAELAAVLASELGRMAAEKKAVDRSELPDPPPPLGDNGNLNAGGISSDQTQLAEQALYDRKYRRRTPRPDAGPSPDAQSLAADILRSAGYKDRDLAAVGPLLSEAGRNRERVAGPALRTEAPRWSP